MAVKVQDHIHLGFDLGSAPENAPSDIFRALQMSPQFRVYGVFKQSLNGKPRISTLSDNSGNPKIYEDYIFEIILRNDREAESLATYNALVNKMWQGIYLVPHRHPDDGENHTSYVRTMVITEVGPIQMRDPVLASFSFRLVLQDFSKSGYATGNTLSGISSAS